MASKDSGWNPWELFRESPEELKIIEKRKAMRTTARAEWLKKRTNPYSSGSGYIFDPAVQRHMSARMARYHLFKPHSTITMFKGFMLYVFPLGLLCYGMNRSLKNHYRRVDSGEIPADKEKFRFMW
ncbi:uncharacterized protein LOC117328047 [Pecten maximus]|uniref:uncharacterized protein LOC117328047 n=1 Tax=Pecten maximus TaxID=6579 RepID=UPI00145888A2|nr:uncharacterized protein LOC117328047 [Pecten maximus]